MSHTRKALVGHTFQPLSRALFLDLQEVQVRLMLGRNVNRHDVEDHEPAASLPRQVCRHLQSGH